VRQLSGIAKEAVRNLKEIGVETRVEHGVNDGGVTVVAVEVDLIAA
jgi:hypothetical protein